jgi:hypothetical protein
MDTIEGEVFLEVRRLYPAGRDELNAAVLTYDRL